MLDSYWKPMAAMLIMMSAPVSAFAAGGDIQLTEPGMDDTGTLMQALRDRASSRSFSPDTLSTEVLSDLLWAAFGINRPDSGRRTAPSAMNRQEIDVYVAMEKGLFLYDAAGGALRLVSPADLRASTGMQPFCATAPVDLVYVADLARMDPDGRGMTEDEMLFWAACDTGFIGQNVYLFCALNGLATVVRGAVDKEALSMAMGLRPGQRIILAQTVGYPGE